MSSCSVVATAGMRLKSELLRMRFDQATLNEPRLRYSRTRRVDVARTVYGPAVDFRGAASSSGLRGFTDVSQPVRWLSLLWVHDLELKARSTSSFVEGMPPFAPRSRQRRQFRSLGLRTIWSARA